MNPSVTYKKLDDITERMKEMEMTGERMVTSVVNQFGTYEHLHRYALASEFVENKIVLDIACGEGYGTNLLSQKAKFINGVDISEESIKHAKEKYNTLNIDFQIGSASEIPCKTSHFDVVVSFETIEHHTEHELMFQEIKRVLKKDGILIISSPEKDIYHLRDPNNLFHIKELTLEELLQLTKRHFKNHIILKQLVTIGSLIIPVRNETTRFATYDGDFYHLNTHFTEYELFNKPFFNIIIAYDHNFQPDKYALASLYNSYSVLENILNENDKKLSTLRHKLDKIYSLKPVRFIKKNKFLKKLIKILLRLD
jgi:2-polyprenyl-3-methyl-5-hydroxy-6-metoxy-1,4-benzoquinol methylase